MIQRTLKKNIFGIPDYHPMHYKIGSFAVVSSTPSPQKKIGEKRRLGSGFATRVPEIFYMNFF